MTPELSSPAPMAALPVRRREVLEILDTALKLYRRYFWVLIGWSALISSLSLIPFVQWLGFFASPLLFGAVSCCVAAAVRGQSVKFSQCWAFTKPRYGPLLGTLLLSYLVLIGIFLAIWIAGFLLGLLGAFVLSNAPQPLQIVGTILGVVLAIVAFSVLGVGAFGWMSMVPIVVCLEDDKRSTAAMGRAFDLLKGNWRRVFGLSLILGLAVTVVFTLVGVIYALFGIGGASGIFGSNPSQGAIAGAIGSLAGFIGVFSMLWGPAQTLVIAVLYLDLRVRREALDLEWTAYSSAPLAPPNADFASFDTPASGAANSGAALRVGSPFGEGDGAPDSPASFGAGRAEIPNPYGSETSLSAQTPLSPPVQVTPGEVGVSNGASPFSNNSTSSGNEFNSSDFTGDVAASVPNVLTDTFTSPESVVSSAQSVFPASPVSLDKPAPTDNFALPQESASPAPVTTSFAPPTSGFAPQIVPAPVASPAPADVLPVNDAPPAQTHPGENEARRD